MTEKKEYGRMEKEERKKERRNMRSIGGLMAKVLAGNRKVACSSPTRYRLFSPIVYSASPSNEEVFVTTSFEGDAKPSVLGSWLMLATGAIPASLLVTFGKTLVKKGEYEGRKEEYKCIIEVSHFQTSFFCKKESVSSFNVSTNGTKKLVHIIITIATKYCDTCKT